MDRFNTNIHCISYMYNLHTQVNHTNMDAITIRNHFIEVRTILKIRANKHLHLFLCNIIVHKPKITHDEVAELINIILFHKQTLVYKYNGITASRMDRDPIWHGDDYINRLAGLNYLIDYYHQSEFNDKA